MDGPPSLKRPRVDLPQFAAPNRPSSRNQQAPNDPPSSGPSPSPQPPIPARQTAPSPATASAASKPWPASPQPAATTKQAAPQPTANHPTRPNARTNNPPANHHNHPHYQQQPAHYGQGTHKNNHHYNSNNYYSHNQGYNSRHFQPLTSQPQYSAQYSSQYYDDLSQGPHHTHHYNYQQRGGPGLHQQMPSPMPPTHPSSQSYPQTMSGRSNRSSRSSSFSSTGNSSSPPHSTYYASNYYDSYRGGNAGANSSNSATSSPTRNGTGRYGAATGSMPHNNSNGSGPGGAPNPRGPVSNAAYGARGYNHPRNHHHHHGRRDKQRDGSRESGVAGTGDMRGSVAAALAAVAKQRIFSDFRIARVKIGKFEALEGSAAEASERLHLRKSSTASSSSSSSSTAAPSLPPPPARTPPALAGAKDSRLRLYFRGSGNDTPRYLSSHGGAAAAAPANAAGTANNASAAAEANPNSCGRGQYPTPEEQAARERALAEPDRLSISLYHGTKRIVIPVQDGIDKILFRRADGYVRIKSRGWALFEELDERSAAAAAVASSNRNSASSASLSSMASSASTATFSRAAGHFRRCDDITHGQLEAANGLIEAWIDLERPLPVEPKWTRGNLADYIDARSKYLSRRVLEVVDPEPIVDFDAVVGLWVRESAIETEAERRAFAEAHLGSSSLPHILELCSRVLAPPYYYVSKALAATANNPSGLPTPPSTTSVVAGSSGGAKNGNSGEPPTTHHHLNTAAAASILESGQIPALISPAVNMLLATLVKVVTDRQDAANGAELVALLKPVLFQVPEPVIWRSLDGLFARRSELAGPVLHFDADAVLAGASARALQKKTQLEEAAVAAAELQKELDAMREKEETKEQDKTDDEYMLENEDEYTYDEDVLM